MNETINDMKIWKIQFPYTVTLPLESSEYGLTKVTIETTSEEVLFAKTQQDANEQKLLSNAVSGDGYIKHIINFISNEIGHVEYSKAQIKYTDEPTITVMTEDELQNFQRDVTSLSS